MTDEEIDQAISEYPKWFRLWIPIFAFLFIACGVISVLLWMRFTYHLCLGQPDWAYPGWTWKEWPFATAMNSFFLTPFLSRRKKAKNETQNSCSAEFLLHLLLPREDREAVIGDLNEEANAISEKFGSRNARLFLWCEVLKSIGPLAWRVVQKLLGFGILDWIRRHVHI